MEDERGGEREGERKRGRAEKVKQGRKEEAWQSGQRKGRIEEVRQGGGRKRGSAPRYSVKRVSVRLCLKREE